MGLLFHSSAAAAARSHSAGCEPASTEAGASAASSPTVHAWLCHQRSWRLGVQWLPDPSHVELKNVGIKKFFLKKLFAKKRKWRGARRRSRGLLQICLDDSSSDRALTKERSTKGTCDSTPMASCCLASSIVAPSHLRRGASTPGVTVGAGARGGRAGGTCCAGSRAVGRERDL